MALGSKIKMPDLGDFEACDCCRLMEFVLYIKWQRSMWITKLLLHPLR